MAEDDELVLACSAIIAAAAGVNYQSVNNRKQKKETRTVWVKKCIRERDVNS
jgi:hypothetical protein